MCCNGFRILLMFSFAAIAFVLNNYFATIPVIVWYLVSINIFTFFLTLIDKYHAIKERKRVPEFNLYFFSFAGGFLGLILGMIIAKHKTSKKLFMFIQAIIAIFWLVAIYYILTHLEAIQRALSSSL